jgi:tripartite-type tricarboxylate transporter receptor subunit TctC
MLGLLCAPTLQAQPKTYPDRPVRLVNPNPPGGPSDLVARALVEPFRARFSQPLIVENRAGAGGNVGSEVVAKSPPDGLNLLVITDTVVTVNPHVYKKMGFDPARDLVPVALLTGFSQTLVCNATVPAKTVAELVALAKKQPLNYASGGAGVPGHLAMELFLSSAGIDMNHVPYKGPAAATQDVIGGQVHCGFLATATVLPHIKSGRLHAFAISSTRRSPLAPQVPTMAEAGYRDYDATFYLVLMAPRGTPDEILRSLNAFVNDALKSPDAQDKVLTPADQIAAGGSPADAAAKLREISAKWEKVVKRIGLSLD